MEYSCAPASAIPLKGVVFPKKSTPPVEAPKKDCKFGAASMAGDPIGNLNEDNEFSAAG